MANELTKTGAGVVSVIASGNIGDIIKPLVNEIWLLDTYIAGLAYTNDPDCLADIVADDELPLRREPDNRFDENAIAIYRGESRIGYVTEKDNKVFTRLMDAGKFIKAKVRYNDDQGYMRKIGIALYLVDY